jgi:hypothetical protein
VTVLEQLIFWGGGGVRNVLSRTIGYGFLGIFSDFSILPGQELLHTMPLAPKIQTPLLAKFSERIRHRGCEQYLMEKEFGKVS